MERIPNITLKIVIKSQVIKAKEERNKRKLQKLCLKINKMAISTYLSIISLNINDLNNQIKRY